MEKRKVSLILIFIVLILILNLSIIPKIISQEELIEEEVDLSEEDVPTNDPEDNPLNEAEDNGKVKVNKTKVPEKPYNNEKSIFDFEDYKFTIESYIAIALGIVAICIIGYLGFSFFKMSKKN